MAPGTDKEHGPATAQDHGTRSNDKDIDDTEDRSLTAKYLSSREAIGIPVNRRAVQLADPNERESHLVVRGARHNNLKNIDVALPLARFVAVTGVSGSGKSSLVTETLWPALAKKLQGAMATPGAHDAIDGLDLVDKVISVDQSPIGQTPASNAATYTGLFDEVRKLFARMPASKMRGFTPGRFSFNKAGGRCEDCEGMGSKCVQMHFLPDVWVVCDTCDGKRFNAATLEVTFHGKSINDVLEMPVAEAAVLFQDVPKLRRILQTLLDVGLDYLPLGQSGTTLSGGEAQRIKLAAELARPQTGRTIYILDEPTTGLHFDDIRKLLIVLHRLVDQGNTVICIEHNLDLIKQADWVIDLGPGPAERGGEVVTEGTPETIVTCKESLTGRVLRPILEAGPYVTRKVFDPKEAARKALGKATTGDRGQGTGNSQQQQEQTRGRAGNMAADNAAMTPSEDDAGGGSVHARGQRGRGTRKGSNRETRNVDSDDIDEIEDDATAPAPEATDWSGLPWKKDGQAWHLEQRHRTGAQPRRWDADALRWLIQRVEQIGGNAFEHADWANVAHVEVRAVAAKEPTDWFLHVLTSGSDLFDAYFRVPDGTFNEARLLQQLAIPTLDERSDAPIGGNWQRVQVRTDARNIQSVRIQAFDLKDIRTKGFEAFLQEAVKAYLKGLGGKQEQQSTAGDATMDRRAWHLAGKAIQTGQRPKWSATMLATLCGLLIKHLPHVKIDWSHKTGATLRSDAGQRLGRIITNKADWIEVWLFGPAGTFEAKDVLRVGAKGWIQNDTDDPMEIRFRLIGETHLNNGTGEFLQRWAEAVGGKRTATKRPGRGVRRGGPDEGEEFERVPVEEFGVVEEEE
jgi:excinuclease ABC subunit A